MDVVIAHQAGQSNVVGTIGTALTDRHAELLKRIAKRVILSLDPDAAGDLAALKGSEVLQEHAETNSFSRKKAPPNGRPFARLPFLSSIT
jgi:DNA primase